MGTLSPSLGTGVSDTPVLQRSLGGEGGGGEVNSLFLEDGTALLLEDGEELLLEA